MTISRWKKCCWSKDTNKMKCITKHLMLKLWQLPHWHLQGCMRDENQRVGRWGAGGRGVWFKLLRRVRCLRHRYLNIPLLRGQTDCAFKASLGVLVGKLKPSVPVSLLPYYLTLIKHYMAQQKGSQSQQLPPWVSISAVTWESFFNKKKKKLAIIGEIWLSVLTKLQQHVFSCT